MQSFYDTFSHLFSNFFSSSTQNLNDAILRNKSASVKAILRNSPQLLLETNDYNQTPLHLALSLNFPYVVDEILNVIDKNKELKSVLFAKDDIGWTCLHYAARCCSLPIVNKIIAALGPKAHEMALSVSFDEGLVPLFLARRSKHKDKKFVKHRVKEITIEKASEDLTEPVQFSKLIANNASWFGAADETLLQNLHYGCIAATHVRSYINQAPSHINSNSLPIHEYQALWTDFERLRKTYQSILGKIKGCESNEELFRKLSILQNFVKTHNIANCVEYADLVAYTLAKIGIKDKIEVFEIKNDDHVFTVLGRDPKSKISDFKTWGPKAVVIDAWAGQVYPASEIPEKLKGYQTYLNSFKTQYRANVIFPFDPRYHVLARYFEIKPSYSKHPNKLNLYFLSPEEIQTFHDNESLIKTRHEIPCKIVARV